MRSLQPYAPQKEDEETARQFSVHGSRRQRRPGKGSTSERKHSFSESVAFLGEAVARVLRIFLSIAN